MERNKPTFSIKTKKTITIITITTINIRIILMIIIAMIMIPFLAKQTLKRNFVVYDDCDLISDAIYHPNVCV